MLRRRKEFYERGHSLSADVLLVVEVAETSIVYEREEKIPRYVRALIPGIWLIDVEGETITQYTQPDRTRYGSEQILERGKVIVCQAVDSLQLSVDDIFG